MEPLRAIAKKRLATILETPTGFGVAGLDIRSAALPGVEGHLLAVGFVLRKRDRLHIHAGGGIFIYLRVRDRQHLHASAPKFLNLALGRTAVAPKPREIMDDDHRDGGVATGAVDHSMELVTPSLVTVSAGRLLKLSHNLDPMLVCVAADLTELFGHRQSALFLLPG
jgi:hypothetical protein